MSNLFNIVLKAVSTVMPLLKDKLDENAAKAVAFTPDPLNDKVIFIKGWSKSEIFSILNDFAKSYAITDARSWNLTESNNLAFELRFPNDITPLYFLYLINYLNYPTDFDLKSRSIAIRGDCTLTSAFTLPNPAFSGIKASIYTPENDDAFDLVYIHLSSGETYEASFRKSKWKPASQHRMSASVKIL